MKRRVRHRFLPTNERTRLLFKQQNSQFFVFIFVDEKLKRVRKVDANLAKDLCARAPNVLASIKELVNDAADQTLSGHLAAEKKHFVKNLHHPNGGEGIRSFMEKRTAHYK